MKRILLIIFVLLGCSKPNVGHEDEIKSSQIPESATLQDYTEIDGLQKAAVTNGDITLSEGDFLNGRHHGSWVQYDQNGKVTSITTYMNGEKQGVELLFDKQGYVSNKAYYHKNQLEGEYLLYKRRNIIERRHYSGGMLNGTLQKFYADGVVMEESSYVNDKIHGTAKWYDKEGKLKIEYTYDMGNLVKENDL